EKKNVAIIVLAIALAASGVGNIILGLQGAQFVAPPNTTLVYGTASGPHVLDPVNAWDSASNDVIEQIAERLFAYNFSRLDLPRYPLLAETYWWETNTILHIKVREGIVFHDLTPFDANATKWNLDRLLYLTNCTGTLPSTMVPGDPSSLYFFPDGVTPIINNVVSDGAYNVTITLNAPFAPFLDLLCYTAGSMLSPASTPDDDFISLTYGRLIGTGPFVWEYYVPNVEVRLGRFDYYWQGPAFFEEVIMAIITDPTTRNNAMLGHEIDYLSGLITSLLDTYRADPTIHVEEYSFDNNVPSLVYQYLGMNNVLIPTHWRKAISYAVNYTYIIDELLNGLGIRANGPISPGYGAPYNASNQAAVFDLAVARQVVVDNVPAAAGFPVNNDPTDATWLGATLATFNYTYNIGNSFREDMLDALEAWLPAIGINVVDDGVTWSAYLRKLFGDYDELGLFFIGWAPDYKDPFNMLDPLFNPASYADSGQVDDSKLNGMIALALTTTDDTARANIYKNIQWYLANRLYPHVFVYHSVSISIHSADLYGFWYNVYGALRFYPIYRA
ncbi:MAG: ABC transporter substrate-binding protein, partial [Candidatus Heimdallarchaeota archaeon]